MPLNEKPACAECKVSNSSIWRKNKIGEVVCNSCSISQQTYKDGSTSETTVPGKCLKLTKTEIGATGNTVGSQFIGPIRKSARLKPSKHKFQTVIKPLATKGKSRRVIFKKNPIKAAPSVATVVTSDFIFHDGQYWQVGDIVSVMDHSGEVFYAQLRGFLQDQYCASSAVITWLLPSTVSRRDIFEPATYILGPEEELPRPMECFEFISHAPSDYFCSKKRPYLTIPDKPEIGFISTRLEEGFIGVVPSHDELYGLNEERQLYVSGRKEKRKDKNHSPIKERKEKNVAIKKESKAKTKTEVALNELKN